MKVVPIAVSVLALTALTVIAIAIGLHYSKSKPKGFAILMYHDISPKESRFSVTPANFRKHLQALYDAGFVTSRLDDIINKRYSKTCKKYVVLRFDDSRKSQFRYIRDQQGSLIIDPECAVGIIIDFAKTHPGFGHHAVFCIVATEQFHQPRYAKQKLLYLLDNGMEIINHTFDHEPLVDATSEDIDNYFGKAMEIWEHLIGHRAQEITILAAPYGVLPRSAHARNRMKHFCWQDKWYKPSGVLCAGRRYHVLCPSPNCPQFNPFELPSFDVTNDNFDEILAHIKTIYN